MNEGTWYRTGTVSLTNGSDLVTGYGTEFIDNVLVGGIFFAPEGTYEVARVVSDTALRLVGVYLGPTVAGAEFEIAPTQGAVVAATKQLQAFLTDLGPLKQAWETGDLNAKGLVLKGVKNTEADLPSSGNTAGDGWLVDETLWVWTGTAWHNAGALVTTPALEALRVEVVDAKNIVVEAQQLISQLWYGPLAADPEVSPIDGSAVLIGAEYFNTADQTKRTFTSTGWRVLNPDGELLAQPDGGTRVGSAASFANLKQIFGRY